MSCSFFPPIPVIFWVQNINWQTLSPKGGEIAIYLFFSYLSCRCPWQISLPIPLFHSPFTFCFITHSTLEPQSLDLREINTAQILSAVAARVFVMWDSLQIFLEILEYCVSLLKLIISGGTPFDGADGMGSCLILSGKIFPELMIQHATSRIKHCRSLPEIFQTLGGGVSRSHLPRQSRQSIPKRITLHVWSDRKTSWFWTKINCNFDCTYAKLQQ